MHGGRDLLAKVGHRRRQALLQAVAQSRELTDARDLAHWVGREPLKAVVAHLGQLKPQLDARVRDPTPDHQHLSAVAVAVFGCAPHGHVGGGAQGAVQPRQRATDQAHRRKVFAHDVQHEYLVGVALQDKRGPVYKFPRARVGLLSRARVIKRIVLNVHRNAAQVERGQTSSARQLWPEGGWFKIGQSCHVMMLSVIK